MNNIAIIPARGGSKGVPGKNLRQVLGKSLVHLAIEAADTPFIKDIIVSTDSEEIKNEAQKFGAKVLGFRAPNLSTDNAKTVDVVLDTIENYESLKGSIDNILLLEPTSPFRTVKHVNLAFEKYFSDNFNSLVSVTSLSRKPENIFVKQRELKKYIIEPDEKFEQRQQMDHLCRLNSAIYIANKDLLLSEKKFLLPPIGWISMTELESVNIDTELDLLVAKVISKQPKT